MLPPSILSYTTRSNYMFYQTFVLLVQEREGKLDYNGFSYALSLGSKGSVVKLVFEWEGAIKPVNSRLGTQNYLNYVSM